MTPKHNPKLTSSYHKEESVVPILLPYTTQESTYLVKTLQQAHDAALNLLLLQTTTSTVHANRNEALSADGNRGSDSTGSSGREH
jgi:hypothetical protein